MAGSHRSPVDVLVLLLRGDEVLLTRRAGAIYAAGQWALPSGSVEADEDVLSAARRELAEELGITVEAAELSFLGVTHARPPHGDARIGFGLRATRWQGEPVNREPDKCSSLAWWPLTALPEPTMAYTREVVRLHLRGEPFSLYGWPTADPPPADPPEDTA